MSRFASNTAFKSLLGGGVVAALLCVSATRAADGAPSASPPDFGGFNVGWTSMGGEWIPMPGAPAVVTQDPRREYVPNNVGRQPTFRYANADNPNLTPWAKEQLKNDNARQDEGFAMYSRSARCWSQGVPVFLLNPARPTYFVQTPKLVLMISETDHQIRRIYMNVPHSVNPKPSWYGELVGHYEGDELVIDTIGQNTNTFIDNFRTPHGPKLHVVERIRMVDGGKTLQQEIAIEDPDALVRPWHVVHRSRRVDAPMQEFSCAEFGDDHFPLNAEPIPRTGKPDF